LLLLLLVDVVVCCCQHQKGERKKRERKSHCAQLMEFDVINFLHLLCDIEELNKNLHCHYRGSQLSGGEPLRDVWLRGGR